MFELRPYRRNTMSSWNPLQSSWISPSAPSFLAIDGRKSSNCTEVLPLSAPMPHPIHVDGEKRRRIKETAGRLAMQQW